MYTSHHIFGKVVSLMYSVHAHLPTLISNAISCTATDLVWQELPSPPVTGPTLLALQNHLLLVGGWGRRMEIYRYEPESEIWSACAQLPARMYAPSCAVLPSGDLFVAGEAMEGVGIYSKQVWIGSLD